MKKKLAFGLAVLGVGSLFWACGSGEIINPDSNDEYMKSMVGDLAFEGQIADAMAQCEANVECNAAMVYANQGAQIQHGGDITSSEDFKWTFSSASAWGDGNGNNEQPSPTSSYLINNNAKSSSSIVFGTFSSSSDNVIVDPNGPTGVTDPGVCKPSKNPINKGESVDWTFTRGSGIASPEILTSSFVWTFEGGLPATVSENASSGVSIKGVSYANSGKFTPTMAVTKANGLGAKIACEPLQVNGVAITNCVCSAVNATKNLKGVMVVDVVSATSVEYAVTGCTAAGANITSYTWAGATGTGNAASAPVAAKGDVVHAMVAVANDDNTEIQVDCGEVLAIDSRIPDYEITGMSKMKGITFKGENGQVAATIVMNIPAADIANQSPKFACEVTRGNAGGDGKISGTVGTSKITGGDYVTTNSLPTNQLTGGFQLEILIDIGQNESINCFITN